MSIRSADVRWDELVTIALLGTDRRDPPSTDDAIGDVVADAMEPTPAERMLTLVAASAAVRRAAFVPQPSVSPIEPAPTDDRPICPRAVTQRWRHLVSSWPVLEDEWLITVIERGWRVDPEIVPAMLSRHRTDAARRATVMIAVGPLAGWLMGQLEGLRPAASDRSGPTRFDADSIGALPTLPIPSDLAELMQSDGERIGDVLVDAIAVGSIGAAHRNVVINALARVDPAKLGPIVRQLDAVSVTSSSHALAAALADLARTRRAMWQELADPARR